MKIMYRKLILITVTVMLLLCGCSDSKETYDFDNNKENMETIAVEIVQGKYEISENGLVKLPEELIDKCSNNIDFVNEKEICEGWYSVSTD